MGLRMGVKGNPLGVAVGAVTGAAILENLQFHRALEPCAKHRHPGIVLLIKRPRSRIIHRVAENHESGFEPPGAKRRFPA